MKIYKIADQLINYQFIYPETAAFFANFEVSAEEAPERKILSVCTTLKQMEQSAERRGVPDAAHTPRSEYEALAASTSAAILPHGAFLFHSVGFTYRGKAIVVTGPSGIGKTTQYAQWKRSYGDDVKVISGDMPAIVFRDDGSIYVMPSPWNGKEHLRSEHQAPLGGIIVLDKAMDNSIVRMEPKDAILPLYSQMCRYRYEKEQLQMALEIEDRLLRKIPIWELSSRGDLESARLCHDAIEGEIYGK